MEYEYELEGLSSLFLVKVITGVTSKTFQKNLGGIPVRTIDLYGIPMTDEDPEWCGFTPTEYSEYRNLGAAKIGVADQSNKEGWRHPRIHWLIQEMRDGSVAVYYRYEQKGEG